MTIYLSGIEWITEPPAGNRLRWRYPADEPTNGSFRGLPETVTVERAEVRDVERTPRHKSTASVALLSGPAFVPSLTTPLSWWTILGDVDVLSFEIPTRHALPPVQAVRFVYHGEPTRLLLRDSARNVTELDTVVRDGDLVSFEGSSLDEIVVYTLFAHLEGLAVLDLFEDRQLDWQEIAKVRMEPTLQVGLGDVVARHGGATSLTDAEWKDLVELGTEAQASLPGGPTLDLPTPWEELDLLLALRWEHAALFGTGFFDGPSDHTSPLDDINEKAALKEPSEIPLAYRVRDAEDDTLISNIVLCWPGEADPLAAPDAPAYVDPEVRLDDTGEFAVNLEMQFGQSDPRAIGVIIEEEVSESPAIGSTATADSFEHRTRTATDGPGASSLSRAFTVPFHDVTLTARTYAVDAWDRVSPPSPSSTTALTLLHEPFAPGLLPGAYAAGAVAIPRQHGDPHVSDWIPDPVVTEAPDGKVHVYRRVAQPRTATTAASLPVPVDDAVYRVTITGVSGLGDFAGGYLNVDGRKFSIVEIVGSDVLFHVPSGGSSEVVLFPAGAVGLQQDDNDLSLWTEVADFPAVGLPPVLQFNDPVPGPVGGTDVLSYVARAGFLGGIGPAGNVSQVIRVTPVPPVPPPFTVELLGVDFYDRTLIKIRLQDPKPTGRFTVWWADGDWTATQFADHGAPGEYGEQTTHDARYLFDVLSLPVPQHQDRLVTIGVQEVAPGGGQGAFVVVTITIPASAS
jgi:hypothetical protein